MSIDMDGFYEQIYAPFAEGTPLLTCGPVTPGGYCDPEVFADTYDPEGTAALLADAGWTQDASGMWVNPDGEVPEAELDGQHGQRRRESHRPTLILRAEAGFNVVADNCEAVPCVFQTRLPALDYDLAMYINVGSLRTRTTSSDNFLCTCNSEAEENGFAGRTTPVGATRKPMRCCVR